MQGEEREQSHSYRRKRLNILRLFGNLTLGTDKCVFFSTIANLFAPEVLELYQLYRMRTISSPSTFKTRPFSPMWEIVSDLKFYEKLSNLNSEALIQHHQDKPVTQTIQRTKSTDFSIPYFVILRHPSHCLH